jgi:dihydroneopterin aldolase
MHAAMPASWTAATPPELVSVRCRRLFVRDYEITLTIGVHAFEKERPQRVLVNVDVYVPLERSTPRGDALHEVVDYDFIRQCIEQRAGTSPVELQETLADGLLAALLAHPDVLAARVSTEKPDVYPGCRGVGVEVFGVRSAPAVEELA